MSEKKETIVPFLDTDKSKQDSILAVGAQYGFLIIIFNSRNSQSPGWDMKMVELCDRSALEYTSLSYLSFAVLTFAASVNQHH